SYLASHPLEVKDELLKFNRPRTQWKLEELQPLVENMDHGRSFDKAKQIFQVASCVSCHKLNGVGNEFGPDLSKLDDKFKKQDILRDILEPSFRINEKFQTVTLQTDTGQVVTGLIVAETPEELKLVENPLVKCEPLVVAKSSIEDRTPSKVSLMPQGLLDKL